MANFYDTLLLFSCFFVPYDYTIEFHVGKSCNFYLVKILTTKSHIHACSILFETDYRLCTVLTSICKFLFKDIFGTIFSWVCVGKVSYFIFV